MEDGRWLMEDGRWKMVDGRWRMVDGRFIRRSFFLHDCLGVQVSEDGWIMNDLSE